MEDFIPSPGDNKPLLRFHFEDIVYHVLNNKKGIVTGIMLRPSGIIYQVVMEESLEEKPFFDFELTTEPDYTKN